VEVVVKRLVRWLLRYGQWRVVLLVAIAAAIAVVAFVVDTEAQKGVPTAVIGAAIELLFVGLIGGVLTAAIQEQLAAQEEARRQEAAAAEDRRRLNDYRLRLLLDVVSAYNLVKGARRTLRAAGLMEPTGTTLDAWQVDRYRTELSTINEAQLQIEKIGRELETDLAQLTRHQEVVDGIEAAKSYLENILRGWEKESPGVELGEVAALTRQEALTNFLSTTKDENHFRVGMSSHMDRIERAIREDMRVRGAT
jgi:hypothetical protein